jgi:hypothetical protein
VRDLSSGEGSISDSSNISSNSSSVYSISSEDTETETRVRILIKSVPESHDRLDKLTVSEDEEDDSIFDDNYSFSD